MIIELKAYIAKHQTVNLVQLCKAFMTNAQTLEPMLQHWLNKGLIKPYSPCNSCQISCQGCSTAISHWYQWHDLSKNISSADA